MHRDTRTGASPDTLHDGASVRTLDMAMMRNVAKNFGSPPV